MVLTVMSCFVDKENHIAISDKIFLKTKEKMFRIIKFDQFLPIVWGFKNGISTKALYKLA